MPVVDPQLDVHPPHAPVTGRQAGPGEGLVESVIRHPGQQPADPRGVGRASRGGKPPDEQLRHPTITCPTAAVSPSRLPGTGRPTTPSAPTRTWPVTAGRHCAPGPT